MCPRVQADPSEIRRFLSNLKRFNQELDSITRRLKSNLNALGNSWRDTEYSKFQNEMNEMLRVLARYRERSDQYANYLRKQAENLERYLSAHL